MKDLRVILKPGKDKAIRQHHHWIFSGAVQKLPSFADGDFLPVYTAKGDFLGKGYFNRRSSIVGRMLSFDQSEPLTTLKYLLDEAIALRHKWFQSPATNAYRLVNAEGDGIPGLIIDQYHHTLVCQISTVGIERLKPWLIDYLQHTLQPQTIYEKSSGSARREEGLNDYQGFLLGEMTPEIKIMENDFHFLVSLVKGQKTGFFLDHREMRAWIRDLAKDKKVLNAFSYTGGFSVYALAGGAHLVDSVDISEDAIHLARQNVALNGFSERACEFFTADVFEFLRTHPLNYDLVILDPPAFAKKQKDVVAACRGYKDINRLAMQKMPSHSLLLSCSCSHYVDDDLFQKVLFQAAYEAKRQVRIIGKHRLGIDHPINVFHPESAYLKSFLMYLL